MVEVCGWVFVGFLDWVNWEFECDVVGVVNIFVDVFG